MSAFVTESSTRAILGLADLRSEVGLLCVLVTLAFLLMQDVASGTDTVIAHRLRRGAKIGLIPCGLSFVMIAVSQLAVFFR